ncbi:MAG: orotate phosphoribosyltransferase [Chloroflexi bacterium OLB15]|nr:MAG: orotate phosphoribosyltransferase [Chloroflexi bacterium OLB15]
MIEQQVARALLEIGAVGFNDREPVRFKSGILSPVYVDNRRVPFYPRAWRVVIRGLAGLIAARRLDFEVIAGIETAGIPHSAALAYFMEMPSVFVRKQAKEHGLKNRVEGGSVVGLRTLLIEDMITTGSSSLSGVQALRDEGAVVTDCLAIVSYGFREAEDAFAAANVRLHTLTNFDSILYVDSYFDERERAVVREWMADPHHWAEKKGLE